MRRKSGLVAAGALTVVALGSVAAARARDDHGAAGLARQLAGLTAGKPMSCMPVAPLSPSTSAYGNAILYTVSPSLKYVTMTDGGCSGIAHGDVLVTRQLQDRPCSGDIATTVDEASHFPTGSCTFGDFVEYRK